jgi:hypothetical protein
VSNRRGSVDRKIWAPVMKSGETAEPVVEKIDPVELLVRADPEHCREKDGDGTGNGQPRPPGRWERHFHLTEGRIAGSGTPPRRLPL